MSAAPKFIVADESGRVCGEYNSMAAARAAIPPSESHRYKAIPAPEVAAPKFTPTTGSQETSTRHSTQSEVEPALVAREKDRSGQQFSSGPWVVCSGNAAAEIRQDVPGAMRRIARVLRADQADIEASRANARLIAAAPELYAALAEVDALMSECYLGPVCNDERWRDGGERRIMAAQAAIRAALARAEGAQ